MQALELVLIAGAALAVAAALLVATRHRIDQDRIWPRLLIGIVPGIVGVGLILVPQVDLVPDAWEGNLWALVAVGTAVVVLAVAVYRSLRH